MSNAFKMAGAVVSGATSLFHRTSGPVIDRGDQEYDQSRSGGRHEARRIERGPTEEEILNRDFQRESHRLGELDSAIGRINHEIRSITAEIPSLEFRNYETKKEIETVDQDLMATRAHAPDEGTMQKGELITEFVALLNMVKDLVNDFQAWYSQFLAAKSLSEGRAGKVKEHFQGKYGMQDANKFVELVIGQRLKLITQLLLHHHLCSAIIHQVFEPLLPGKRIDDIDNEFLCEILRVVQKGESQDCSGRWRALTYKQALIQESREPAWCTDVATEFVREAFHLMGLVTGAKPTGGTLQSTLTRTMQIFEAAALFKDRAMKICTEADFFVYLPNSSWKFDHGLVQEACKSTVASRRVILGVGLGLQLSYNVQDGSRYTRKYEHPVLADAVGEKSTLIPHAW